MQARIVEREHVRIAHVAALRAAEQLNTDLVRAKGKAAEASATTDRLIAGILAFTAEAIAVEHERKTAEAAAVRELLLSYDHHIAGRGIALSPKVRAVLGDNTADFIRRHDKAPWIEAAARLRAESNIPCGDQLKCPRTYAWRGLSVLSAPTIACTFGG